MSSPRPGKLTLLELVQNVLNAMNSDEVNSIGDTVEALQIAEYAREVYYEIISGLEEPDREGAFQLEALSDVARPNYLKVPPKVKSIKTLFYDIQTDSKVTWKEVTYITPRAFITLSLSRASDDNAQAVVDFGGTTHYALSDQAPTYYTTFDDEYLIFDSFDVSTETTLQASRSMVLGHEIPDFVMSDTFIPDLPADKFPLYLSELKQTAFTNNKQVSNANEDRKARRQRVRQLNNRYRSRQQGNPSKNYGR